MAKKPVDNSKIPIKADLLDEDVKKELRKSAKASITEEMTQDARTAYYEEQRARYRRQNVPMEQIVQVTIDVAPFVPNIMIDGVQYFHGYTYSVPHSLRLVLLEQMQRSWQHQDEIDGRSKTEATRRPTNRTIGPADAGTPLRSPHGGIAPALADTADDMAA